MDVILAFERVRVLLFIINALDLNRRVVQFVFAAKKVSHLSQRLERLHRLDVASHADLADGDGPDVQVVYVHYIVATFRVDVFSELLNVDRCWVALHHHDNDVLDDGDGCPEDDDGEEEGAKRVRIPEGREEVNNRSRNDNANAHEHIAKDVQESSVHIDIALFCMLVTVMMVLVRMASVVMLLSLVAFFVLEEGLLDSVILDLVLCRVRVTVRVAAMPVVMLMMGVTVVMVVLVIATKMVMAVASM